MFCPNCGAQFEGNSAFCPSCGQPIAQQAAQQAAQQQYQQQPYQQPYQQQYQQPYQPAYNQPVQQELPMKWHKFLVYFALWASAILNIITGIITLTGGQYGEYKDLVYVLIPGMKAPDVIYGIALIALGLFIAYAAFCLLKFKKGAPKLLVIVYVAALAISVLYTIVSAIILSKYGADLSTVISSTIASAAISILMIFANITYYKKRAHLFVN